MTACSSPLFLLDKLSAGYSRRGDTSPAAIRNLSLSISPGEQAAIIGASGSGKTTLLRLLSSALTPQSGTLKIEGSDVSTRNTSEIRSLRGRIGLIRQDLALVPNIRVLQNILLGRIAEQSFFGSLRTMTRPAAEAVEECYSLLERVGIPEKLYSRTDRLSGGQLQRVAIARALYQRPMALLADEPVSSLDPSRAEALLALLTEIARERKLTLLVSIHNVTLAKKYFDRFIGLRQGGMTFDVSKELLTDQMLNELFTLESNEQTA